MLIRRRFRSLFVSCVALNLMEMPGSVPRAYKVRIPRYSWQEMGYPLGEHRNGDEEVSRRELGITRLSAWQLDIICMLRMMKWLGEHNPQCSRWGPDGVGKPIKLSGRSKEGSETTAMRICECSAMSSGHYTRTCARLTTKTRGA